LSTLLREIRKQAGMSAAELARRSKTSAQMICAYEHGTCLPQAETQARIAAVFGVKPRTIFNGLPKMGRKKGGHNSHPSQPRQVRLRSGQVSCVWCGNGTQENIRMIGVGEDDRRYCSVHCLGEYIWTRQENLI